MITASDRAKGPDRHYSGMVNREDVLEALETHIQEERVPFGSAPEIAERVGISRRKTLDKLQLLEVAGEVDSARLGSGRAFWPADLLAGRYEKGPLADPPADPLADPIADPPEEDDHQADGDGLEEQLRQLDLPGSGDALEARRDAVRLCYEWLQEHGQATKSDFTSDIYPEQPAHYGSEGGWWNTVGKKGLQQLAELRDDIEPPAGEGSHTWESA